MMSSIPHFKTIFFMKKNIPIFLLLITVVFVRAQTLTDGLVMSKKQLCTGLLYTTDQWTDYWEGELKRDNGNIGTITTQSLLWVGNYGITNKINIIAILPYLKTEASQGTLRSMEGLQDVSIGLKYNFFRKDFEKSVFKTFGVLNFSSPLTDYTPDFLPLSIGAQTTNIAYRLTTYFKLNKGWFINASPGYTWRSNTTLDRPSYYDGTDFYISSEVKMPNIFDLMVTSGYQKGSLQAEVSYTLQNTLGGGDIRRQDMPFVSNRMNFSKVGALVMYYLPKPKNLAVRGSIMYTIAGRNVGKSTTLMGGLLYRLTFAKQQ
jgi:hypothetical protein